jgi:serine/threonine protein kinase
MGVLRPGQRFRELRLETLISRGGMGEVWLAVREGPEGFRRELALKVILPTLADQERFVALFLDEARIAARLDHPNIVPALNCGREGELLWIEQQYVAGLDLRRLLVTAGPLPVPLAAFVVVEVLKGLDYAHDWRGTDGKPFRIVHRDVKPHNVLISYDGQVRLTDFGIAKALAETHVTKSEIKGTAGYIAPEVLAGQPATARADLFAVGLVFWESLTGHRLFEGETEEVRLRRTLECVVPPLAEHGVTVPSEIEAVLRRLLARDPADRYPTAGDALRALLAVSVVREVSSLDLRAHLESVARVTPPVSTDSPTNPGHIGAREAEAIPVEIHDAPNIVASAPAAVPRRRELDIETRTRLPDDAAPDPAVATGTGTMAGEVTSPGKAHAARGPLAWIRTRRGVALLGVLAAGMTTAVLVWTSTAPSASRGAVTALDTSSSQVVVVVADAAPPAAARLTVVIPNILPLKSASAAVETGVGCQVQHEPMTRG